MEKCADDLGTSVVNRGYYCDEEDEDELSMFESQFWHLAHVTKKNNLSNFKTWFLPLHLFYEETILNDFEN